MTANGKYEEHSELERAARRCIGNQDGVVIVAVLWICALIMWFALQIGAETRLRGEEQVHQLRRSQALHLAIGGCYEALARMGQPPPLGLDHAGLTNWQPDGKPHVVEYQTGQALVVVEAEGLKVNVNTTNPQQLKLVLGRVGLEESAAERLADVIADFIDQDDVPRLNGAEKDQYKRLGLHYTPFNGPLVSLDQLLLIPGVSPQLFYGYGQKDVNPQIDDSEAARVPYLPSRDSLFELLTVYGTNAVLRPADAEQELAGRLLTWEKGGVYRILSCGRSYTGSPPVVTWLIVRYSPEAQSGYEVLYRKIL